MHIIFYPILQNQNINFLYRPSQNNSKGHNENLITIIWRMNMQINCWLDSDIIRNRNPRNLINGKRWNIEKFSGQMNSPELQSALVAGLVRWCCRAVPAEEWLFALFDCFLLFILGGGERCQEITHPIMHVQRTHWVNHWTHHHIWQN